MNTIPIINTAWHPLASGNPPAWASEWGQDRRGVFVAFTVENVTQRLRWIPPGRFRMGSPEDETRGLAKESYQKEWFEREHPQHTVYLTQGFWLADTPCTQALWEAVMGSNPSRFKSLRRPVEQVSWNDVQTFLQTINVKLPGLDLCLPTEAQWEHACRAKNDTALYNGPIEVLGVNNAPALDPIAWYAGNSGVGYELDEVHDSSNWPEMQYPNPKSGTHEVGQKQPNPWGWYDMLGNVWEWCDDSKRIYSTEIVINPVGSVDTGVARVVRGGSWVNGARVCRSAFRFNYVPGHSRHFIGFRFAQVQS